MRIEKLILDDEVTKAVGINSINLERLGSVVAFVGKNGSGKTRILNLIEKKYFSGITLIDFLEENIQYPPNNLSHSIQHLYSVKDILITQQKLRKLKTQLQNNNNKELRSTYNTLEVKNNTLISNLNPHAAQVLQRFNNQTQKSIQQAISEVIPKFFYKINYLEIQQLKQIINAEDKAFKPFEDIIKSVSESDNYDEFKSIHLSALSFLSKFPHQLVYDFDECYGDEKKFTVQDSYKKFISLKKFIKFFLNKELIWEKMNSNVVLNESEIITNKKGIWKLNERLFNYNEFSDGEKTLFAYSLLFFLLEQNPNIKIKESIILIDEPELHLHPESELAIINGIRKVISEKGQLILTTHSISILSSLSYDEIFMVKDNSVIAPGKTTPGKSLIELMGLDDHIEKLSHFVTNISNWAFLNFMIQCFNDPDTVRNARPDDPEVSLFKKSIKDEFSKNILLDFGSGQGRIYKEIVKDDRLKNKLQYFALEPDENNVDELQQVGVKIIYRNHNELPINFFDYILLCNVLHEIPIKNWDIVLNKIKESLNDNGFIIIIEDMRLPKGEKIAEHGFIIMDQSSLKDLFGLNNIPESLVSEENRYKDRILCTLIFKNQINEISKNTIIAALVTLKSNILNKIKALRRKAITEDNLLSLGRESAFYSQLYINVTLAMQEESLTQSEIFEIQGENNNSPSKQIYS